MKLPKKLDIMDLLDLKEEYLFEQLFYKVNELRDYLSDKEASKGECDCGVDQELHPNTHKNTCKSFFPPQQEEYKGEVGDLWNVGLPEDHPIFDKPKQEECKSFVGGDGYPRCSKCSALLLRADQLKGHKCKPVEKESRGECQCSPLDWYKESPNKDCPRHKPQLKEESPKEDEAKEDLLTMFGSKMRECGRWEESQDYPRADVAFSEAQEIKVKIKSLGLEEL